MRDSVSIALVPPYRLWYIERDRRGGKSMVKRGPTAMVQVNLRLQEQLRKRVEKTAEKSGLSLNQQIVHWIEEGLNAQNTFEEIVRRVVTDTGEELVREFKRKVEK